MGEKAKKKIRKTNGKEIFGYDFSLLNDSPLTADQESSVRFGHPYLAKALSNIVLNSNPPFTLGLFGKWGSGKSTIINLLSSFLAKKKIPTVVFDAWKYQSDSLRRQFLITLDEELDLGLKYKRELNQSLTKFEYPGLFKHIKQIYEKIRVYILAIIIGLALYIATRSYGDVTNWIKSSNLINNQFIDKFFDFSLLLFVINFLQQAFQVTFKQTEIVRTDSAEGFEDRFYNEVLDKIQSEKILIVIDNLDRCKSDIATKLLSDIKTFLTNDGDKKKNKKAIFLIACDNKAIIRHLENSNFDNPSEFLRKFFNASVDIPVFLDLDLDTYTNELLKDTKVKLLQNNSDLNWLITYSFRNNPREIKQFINTLVTQVVLVDQMIKGGQIADSNMIYSNIPFLAKLIIIRQKFPNIFSKIEELACRYGYDWDKIISEYSLWMNDESNVGNPGKKSIRNNENRNFVRFVEATTSIKDENIQVFMRLGQSDEEIKLSQWPNLVISLNSKDLDTSKEILNEVEKDKNFTALDGLLTSYLRTEYRKADKTNDNQKIKAFGSTLTKALGANVSKIPNFINNFVSMSLPEGNKLVDSVEDFPVRIYFDIVYQYLNPKNQKVLIDKFLAPLDSQTDKGIGSYTNTDYSKTLFEYVSTTKSHVLQGQTQRIQAALDYRYYVDMSVMQQLVLTNQGNKYINQTVSDGFASKIINDDLGNPQLLDSKLNLLLKLKPKRSTMLMKIKELIERETAIPANVERRDMLFSYLDKALAFKDVGDSSNSDIPVDNIGYLSVQVHQRYRNEADWKKRTGNIRCAYYLTKLPDADYRSQLISIIKEYMSNCPYESFITLNEDIIRDLIANNSNEFTSLALKDFRIFDNYIKYFPVDQLSGMISSLLNYSKEVDVARKEECFDRIIMIKKHITAEQKIQFYELLLNVKNTNATLAVKYNHKHKLFTKEQKKELE